MLISSWMVMYWMSYANACNTQKHTCSMHIQISSSLIGCAKWWSVMDHVEGCMCQGIMDNRWASCLYERPCLLKLYAEWPFEATNPTYDNSHPHISNRLTIGLKHPISICTSHHCHCNFNMMGGITLIKVLFGHWSNHLGGISSYNLDSGKCAPQSGWRLNDTPMLWCLSE